MEWFLTGYVLAIATLMWAMICARKTGQQRLGYINTWPTGKDFFGHCRAFESVTFEAHIWRLMTFRNPWKIYPPITRKMMGK